MPPELGELGAELDRAAAVATGALDDLREIARGIHPAVLAKGGLRFALKTLARRCPIPVDLQVHAKKRLPEPIEVSAYYFVAEARPYRCCAGRSATASPLTSSTTPTSTPPATRCPQRPPGKPSSGRKPSPSRPT